MADGVVAAGSGTDGTVEAFTTVEATVVASVAAVFLPVLVEAAKPAIAPAAAVAARRVAAVARRRWAIAASRAAIGRLDGRFAFMAVRQIRRAK